MSQIENVSYSGIPLQLSRECIIASVQIDLTDDVVRQFRKKLLELIRESGAKAVILDLSGLEIMDLDDYNVLYDTILMIKVMGAYPVVAGLKAGVVSAIIDLGAKTQDIVGAIDLDMAFELIDDMQTQKASENKFLGDGLEIETDQGQDS